MKRNTIRIIIFFATILLAGLTFTQIIWVKKAYELQEKKFSYDVTLALKNVVKLIMLHNNDSTPIADPVEQISPDIFKVSINDTLHPYYLESLLKQEFRKQEINLDFEYSIYDCFTDSVVYNHVVLAETGNKKQITHPQINWTKDGHYFGVYFPGREKHLFNQMKIWIVSSGLLLCVMLFLAFTISVILKQKRLSEIKTDFINNMTHELKTPISTISLSADVLSSQTILNEPERMKSYVEIIKKENARLRKQVEKVLQVATLDNTTISLNKKEIDLKAIINNSIEIFILSVKENSGTIELFESAVNTVIMADEIHVTNIIHNLIDNACKYSFPKPEIKIYTKNTNNGIVIEITDNGIGIPEDSQKHIFEKFYRVPTGNLHNVKGFGLGLYYAHMMANAHNGYLRFKSKEGKGSTFELYLPYK